MVYTGTCSVPQGAPSRNVAVQPMRDLHEVTDTLEGYIDSKLPQLA